MNHGTQDTVASRQVWAARAWNSIRVPYRVQVVLDRVLPHLGSRFRRIRVGDLTVQIRRNSWDERAARRVIGAREYTPQGTEIRAGDTVIDIGANIGAFAIAAGSAAPGVRVLAFEPDPDNWAMATRNAELNRLGNVRVFRLAVSGEPGAIKLFKGEQGALHTIVPGRLTEPAGFEEVQAVTLAQVMDQHGVDTCAFLKLDCEGAEYDILYKTPPPYLARIRRMAIKYHATVDKARRAHELSQFLERCGFEIVELEDHPGSDDGLLRAVQPAAQPSTRS